MNTAWNACLAAIAASSVLAGCSQQPLAERCDDCATSAVASIEQRFTQSPGITTTEIDQEPLLSWHSLMLEGLRRQAPESLDSCGVDYLYYKLGDSAVDLKANGSVWKRAQRQSVSELKRALVAHTSGIPYRITEPVRLGRYNATTHSFAVDMPTYLVLRSGYHFEELPQDIRVNLNNADKLPQLSMSEAEAEQFMARLKDGSGLYVRYVLSLGEMTTPGAFDAEVLEVQFLDVSAGLGNHEQRELQPAFQVVTM